MAAVDSVELDESLYSRQLAVLGDDAMRKIGASHVLVSGMRGLGVEIAKNIVLGGAKSVTVHDCDAAVYSDLSSQFYLTEADLGKNRAVVSAPRLAELNGYVTVDSYTGQLTYDYLAGFQVVVLTQASLSEQLRISKICHDNNIFFIIADTKGVSGQIFCDFGSNFAVLDPSSEPRATFLVTSITKDNEGLVTCGEEIQPALCDGDYVTFSDIKGMVELNGCKPLKVTVHDHYTFSIGDTSGFGDYVGGGIVTEVRMPEFKDYKSMFESVSAPTFTLSDFAKSSRPAQLHAAFQVLHEYVARHGALPKPRCTSDVDQFMELVDQLGADLLPEGVQPNKDLFRQFASCAAGDLAPLQSVIGGIAAQEVMKACSGKFNSIFQWFYFDAMECLPEVSTQPLTEEDCAPRGCRYDGQIAVFGDKFQQALADVRYFLVGAGALGCELLKNWAMIGLKNIVVTDMDHIEKSNLNRQFLFRPNDIGKSKASCAAEAVRRMNPSLHIEAHTSRVGPETEDVYGEDFFNSLTGVANALDNVDARRYVDSRCVYFGKPLLECGTNGVKASQQVVLPHLTQSYSCTRDPPEKSFPMCMLKNFPSVIQHTLQWARDQFEGLFKLQIETTVEFLTDPDFATKIQTLPPATAAEKLQSVLTLLDGNEPQTFDDCVLWARKLFQENYHNQIQQLLFNFPPDSKTSCGAPFWSGTKRCPHPIDFDAQETTHLDYVMAAANLYAKVFGLEQRRDKAAVAEMASEIILPKFEPQQGVKIAENEEQEQANRNEAFDDDEVEKLIGRLPKARALRLQPIEFEKDDDTNFHIDFIVAASNLRAENYDIPPADRFTSKRIAGKIIPAIATTTSMVVGLICLELYKVLHGCAKLSLYKNGYINLAVPIFAFSEPIPPKKNKYNNVEFTLWDRFEVNGEMTVQQLLDLCKDEHQLEITFVGYGVYALYSSTMPNASRMERLDMPISALVQHVSKTEIPSHVRSIKLILDGRDAAGEDVDDLPYVKYNLPLKP